MMPSNSNYSNSAPAGGREGKAGNPPARHAYNKSETFEPMALQTDDRTDEATRDRGPVRNRNTLAFSGVFSLENKGGFKQ